MLATPQSLQNPVLPVDSKEEDEACVEEGWE
jgi:hypothetical protein